MGWGKKKGEGGDELKSCCFILFRSVDVASPPSTTLVYIVDACAPTSPSPLIAILSSALMVIVIALTNMIYIYIGCPEFVPTVLCRVKRILKWERGGAVPYDMPSSPLYSILEARTL